MSQNEYKEMFENVKISDARLDEIEQAMNGITSTKRLFSLKKMVVVAMAMVMVLSVGVMVGAAINENIKNIEEDETFIPINELIESVTGEIVDSQLGNPSNVISSQTTTITFYMDGELKDYPIDINSFIDENGTIMLDDLKQAVIDEIMAAYIKSQDSVCTGISVKSRYDMDGGLVIEAYTNLDPRNEQGWYSIVMGDGIYLRVNENAEMSDDIEIVDKDGDKYIKLTAKEDNKKAYYNFKYKAEEYTLVVRWERNCYRYEIIKTEELQKYLEESNIAK